ncbi:rRNA cytosine-C5-methyltransferase [Bacteroides graminisolvens]|uniref:methyltransferase RsmF C-terminal domain-like protein n=1 Tax=Bacteroides graminisolvens TaxID=477666 RepID=UPI0023F4DB77|nr:rRNA cytosine-C5-methyltransferase [Bacteroides graminisolvens]
MNLPADFIAYTRHLLGEEEYDKLYTALQQETPVSIRFNPLKSMAGYRNDPRLQNVPWCSTGYYLDERFTFTFDPLFHAGCYYVQEASSMFLEQALKQYVNVPSVMLDLCAAPGGKSTHCLGVLPEGSLLVANEVIRSRSNILAENIIKWGNPRVVVTNNDPANFTCLEHFFDVILTDVPCSGEGMFRKDATAVTEWSQENVDVCWKRQRRILADIWPSLKPGGLLIYSTCTYNTHEDEENLLWMQHELGAEVLPVDTHEEWGIKGCLIDARLPVYRFMPHITKGEGFFLAVLRKPYGKEENQRTLFAGGPKSGKSKNKGGVAPLKEFFEKAKTWVDKNEQYQFLSLNPSTLYAFPMQYQNELQLIQKYLHVIFAGVVIGEVKGKDLIPDHSLAMSSVLRSDIFPRVEVAYEQAIAYLRKEAVTLDVTAPRGYVLLTYKQLPLGFVKNIGNRANNLYPQEWRIRSGYLPEIVRTL